jgi:hypothetical protein
MADLRVQGIVSQKGVRFSASDDAPAKGGYRSVFGSEAGEERS